MARERDVTVGADKKNAFQCKINFHSHFPHKGTLCEVNQLYAVRVFTSHGYKMNHKYSFFYLLPTRHGGKNQYEKQRFTTTSYAGSMEAAKERL